MAFKQYRRNKNQELVKRPGIANPRISTEIDQVLNDTLCILDGIC